MNNLIGHDNTKKQLLTAMRSANTRNVAMPHLLFHGYPGCGKTSMARALAKMTNAPFLSVVPNDMKDYKSVLKMLDQLNHTGYDPRGNRIGQVKPTVLFLDEVHNTPLKGQELLGLVMERFMIESNKPNKFQWVPLFTLVGATTLAGKLSKPFRNRFKINIVFSPYNREEMEKIVVSHAYRLKISLSADAILSVAKRSRGVPRIAVGFLERVRDELVSNNLGIGNLSIVSKLFDDMGIDEEGFTNSELKILQILFETGMPMGLDNLSIMIDEDQKTIKDYSEPFLIRRGMIIVSGRGRVITQKGIDYLANIGKTNKFVKKEISFDYKRA